MKSKLSSYLNEYTEAAPLAVFRILFGLMMVISMVRFWMNGWIEKLYIHPDFHFKFYGFEWVQSLGVYTYVLFFICGLSALFVAVGFKYRWSVSIFFLSFTYIELIDKTTYLNHYYFISVLAFLLIFLPAGAYFSVDAVRAYKKQGDPSMSGDLIPKWTIDSLKVLLSVVYIYAGLAKLNSDWLIEALPLKIWLPSKFDTPLIGSMFGQPWIHYLFSWFGAAYDLCIPFLLLYKRTRIFAFVLVVVFHVLTRVLFPIGMFPYIMIVSALIFFDAGFHKRIVLFLSSLFRYPLELLESNKKKQLINLGKQRIALFVTAALLFFQLVFPWRYLLYPGELFWTEEGYRFSWRVMLMEKSGYAQFKIVDPETGKRFYVDNSDFLTPFQEKQMSFQPDFILEYAHYLCNHFTKKGHRRVEVYAEVQVALNGRLSRAYIDPNVNLAKEKESIRHKNWILPFDDAIKGL